jgi:CheY-like chemotaxis protein
LRVRDRGIGISTEMLPRVFDLFTQADGPLHRANCGLGIGLTLVKQLVEMHGGRIQVRSEGLGKGSEFEVTLPILREQAEPIIAYAPKSRTSKCASVLVVEDNPDVAESLSAVLEALGHRTRVTNDGLAALEMLRSASFDAVLVDIGLPGIDGYEVARRIRMLPNFNGSRLIALTGYGQEEDRQRALRAGFDQHLVKPVNVDHLETLMAEAASSHIN